jgi:hypothetical protein
MLRAMFKTEKQTQKDDRILDFNKAVNSWPSQAAKPSE